MTPREGEAQWKGELEALAAEHRARRAALERELEEKYRDAERRVREMSEKSLQRFQSEERAKLDEYEAETLRMLARADEEWQRRFDEAGAEDMGGELARALSAMLGERGDAR